MITSGPIETPVEEPDGHGGLRSLGLGIGAGLLGWALAIGMFVPYIVVAGEYDQSRVRCGETPVLMYALGLLMLVVVLAVSAGAMYVAAPVWRVDLQPALSRSALFLAPLVVAWLVGIVWFKALVLDVSVYGT